MAEPLYRPNVGVALFNREGQVLIGKCLPDDGPEIIVPGHEWQMPQGGMDEGEDAMAAALRELWEETGVTSAAYIGRSSWAMTYDFPPYDGPPHKLSAFRGQQQRWVAFRFMGQESEIEVTSVRAGMRPEFS